MGLNLMIRGRLTMLYRPYKTVLNKIAIHLNIFGVLVNGSTIIDKI